MNYTIAMALINNAALLLALSAVYEITYLIPTKYKRIRPVVSGMLIAGFCIAIMKVPLVLAPGIMYDARTILISTAALIFGNIPTGITVIVASLFRLATGGAGATPGLAIIFSSALIGLAWRHWLYPRSKKWNWLNIYLMSMTVHVVMLACMLLLPYPQNLIIISEIALPVLLIYPVAAILLSLLLLRQQEIRSYQKQLKESEARYSSYIENAPDGIAVIDETGKLIEVNEAAVKMTGFRKEQLLSMHFYDMIHHDFHDACRKMLKELFHTGSMSTELKYWRQDGPEGWMSVDAVRLSADRYLCFSSDITKRKKAEEDLVYLSNHDYLTGLYNRRFFENEIKTIDSKANLPLSYIAGDINGLKFINDVFGEAEGDRMIVQAAKILQNHVGEKAILARTGGDEFDILLPNTDLKTASEKINEIRKAFHEYNRNLANDGFHINLSFGMATKEYNGEEFAKVMKMAGTQMYQSKLLEKKSSHSAVLESIKAAMQENSYETKAHAERLINLSKKIAAKLNLEQWEKNHLILLATLHDIGKVGVSDRILNKPDKLDEEEWNEIKKHPEIGYRIAISSSELAPIADYILCHHERWDGKGYPQKIAGKEIPLLSRIISVVDAYDAMTQDRPYRKAIKRSDAIKEIKKNSGTQFDPEIVDVFLDCI